MKKSMVIYLRMEVVVYFNKEKLEGLLDIVVLRSGSIKKL